MQQARLARLARRVGHLPCQQELAAGQIGVLAQKNFLAIRVAYPAVAVDLYQMGLVGQSQIVVPGQLAQQAAVLRMQQESRAGPQVAASSEVT